MARLQGEELSRPAAYTALGESPTTLRRPMAVVALFWNAVETAYRNSPARRPLGTGISSLEPGLGPRGGGCEISAQPTSLVLSRRLIRWRSWARRGQTAYRKGRRPNRVRPSGWANGQCRRRGGSHRGLGCYRGRGVDQPGKRSLVARVVLGVAQPQWRPGATSSEGRHRSPRGSEHGTEATHFHPRVRTGCEEQLLLDHPFEVVVASTPEPGRRL